MSRANWAVPDAFLVAPYDTPREQWLELRRQGIGGSDALAAMGLDRWCTRMRLYLDKIGQGEERDPTDAMLWGSMVEDTIAEWFTFRTGIGTRRCGLLRSHARPWQQVSVDRLTADGGVLEIKNTNFWRRVEWDDDQVADGAEAQGQHALAVTGRSHTWFAAQIAGQPPVFRRIDRNDTFIENMNALEAEMWQMITDRTAPALTAGDAVLVAEQYPQAAEGTQVQVGAECVDLLREYAAAHADEIDGKHRKEAIKAQVTALIGGAEAAVHNGQVVATWRNGQSQTVCDIDLLRERWPEVAAQVLSRKPGRRFASKLLREETANGEHTGPARRSAA
jgi:putative phage-type endonuclease